MALISCPECGREVSTRAEACPQCACPLRPAEADLRGVRTVQQTGKGLKAAMVVWTLVTVAAIGGFMIGMIEDDGTIKLASAGVLVLAVIALVVTRSAIWWHHE